MAVKPTNTGLLVHYQSHVDNRYKRSLLTTMLVCVAGRSGCPRELWSRTPVQIRRLRRKKFHAHTHSRQLRRLQLCSIARSVCPLHGLTFRRSVSASSLYSHVWTTLITLSTSPLIPLSTRELLTSSHCRLREKWREMT